MSTQMGIHLEDQSDVVITGNTITGRCCGAVILAPGVRTFEGCPVDEDGNWITPHAHVPPADR